MVISRFVVAAAVVASVAALPVPAFAQQVGLKGGLNFASLTEEPEPEVGITQSGRTGLVGGVWVRMLERSRFSFQIEGLYSEKGAAFEIDEFDDLEADIKLTYIEVPLLGRIDLAPAGSNARFYLLGGAAPAFKISARFSGEADGEEDSEDISDDVESLDLGLVGGAGIEIGRALIEARYTHGLRTIAKEDADLPQADIKNRVFSVMVGFRPQVNKK